MSGIVPVRGPGVKAQGGPRVGLNLAGSPAGLTIVPCDPTIRRTERASEEAAPDTEREVRR